MARRISLNVDGTDVELEMDDDVTDEELNQFLVDNEDALVARGSQTRKDTRTAELTQEHAEGLSGTERFLVGAGREITSAARGVAQAGVDAASGFVGALPSNPEREADKKSLDTLSAALAADDLDDQRAFDILDKLPGTAEFMGPLGQEDVGQIVVDAATLALGGASVKGLAAAGSILGSLEVVDEDETRAGNAVVGGITGLLAGVGGKVVGGFIPGKKSGTSEVATTLKQLGANQSKVKLFDQALTVAKFIPGVRLLALDRVIAAGLRRASGQQFSALQKAFAKSEANPAQSAQREAVIRFISPLLGGPGFQEEEAE